MHRQVCGPAPPVLAAMTVAVTDGAALLLADRLSSDGAVREVPFVRTSRRLNANERLYQRIDCREPWGDPFGVAGLWSLSSGQRRGRLGPDRCRMRRYNLDPLQEEQAFEVIEDVGQADPGRGACRGDGADEQVRPILLRSEDVLNARAYSRFCAAEATTAFGC